MNALNPAAPQDAPTFSDIEAAAERLRGHAVVTPLLENAALNERAGGRVLIKPENLQRTGTFKFRGAFSRMSRLSPDELRRGVAAYSSGNHAQGVPAAGAILGAPTVIVMPADSPTVKVEGARRLGAEVIFYDRWTEKREEIGAKLARDRGMTLVPPYEHPDIIAGQGTAGLEMARQAEAVGARLEAVLVCTGGGGLTAGVALAMEALSPDTAVYSVEPQGFDDTRRSLEAGQRVGNDPRARSICDALLAPEPGRLTFSVNGRLLKGGLVVTDTEVADAMRYAFAHLKLVLEPGGAVTLAAILSGKLPTAGRTVGIVCSGGNVDPELFARILAGEL
ncbi:MAG: threonine/serine dehydratase [Proteobacteria bacterium]|nr:threonine/serine dehydratase [Pseudomonadota bacterium]